MQFKLQTYPCAVCRSEQSYTLFTLKGFTFVKCKHCGFVYVNPRISNEKIALLYTENYFQNTEFGYEKYELNSTLRIKNFERWYKKILEYAPIKKGNALDIGCAAGYFLEIIKKDGWNIEGIELENNMIETLTKKKIPVFTKPFEKFTTDKKYSLITLFDVIEHIPELHMTLTKLEMLLEPNGIIAIITPNINSLQRKLLGKKWFQFKPYEHIHYFSLKTFSHALKKHNLKIIHYSSCGQYADYNFIINRLNRYNFKILAKIFETLGNLLFFKNKYWYTNTGSMFIILSKKN